MEREYGKSNCNLNIDDVRVEYNDIKKEKMWEEFVDTDRVV